MHQQGCHLDSSAGSISPLDITKRRGLFSDSVTAAQIITEGGHCFLATTRDPSSPFLVCQQLEQKVGVS